jgi:hypothetical protein
MINMMQSLRESEVRADYAACVFDAHGRLSAMRSTRVQAQPPCRRSACPDTAHPRSGTSTGLVGTRHCLAWRRTM